MLLPSLPRRATLAAVGLLGASSLACRSSAEERTAPGAASAVASAPASAAASTLPADSAARRAAADSGRILGAPTAKVWMLIASDFQCPYCKMWHDETFAALRREYVETGKVRMAFVHFPLDNHAQAKPASEASMCASAQGKFWEYHTALFEAPDSWSGAGDRSAAFEAAARRVGLDVPAFQSCVRSGVMRALVDADKDRMLRAGVNSTPSFFVGNRAVAGAQPLPVFRAAIDSALATTR